MMCVNKRSLCNWKKGLWKPAVVYMFNLGYNKVRFRDEGIVTV